VNHALNGRNSISLASPSKGRLGQARGGSDRVPNGPVFHGHRPYRCTAANWRSKAFFFPENRFGKDMGRTPVGLANAVRRALVRSPDGPHHFPTPSAAGNRRLGRVVPSPERRIAGAPINTSATAAPKFEARKPKSLARNNKTWMRVFR
jgi:hypothetical protein